MWNFVYAIGRVALVAIFVKYGVDTLLDPSGLAGLLANKTFPMPRVLAYGAGVAQLGLGLLVAIGWQTRLAAMALIAYVVVATLIAHQYWGMTGPARVANAAQFWKNAALIGGLVMLMAGGAGRYSVDRR